MEAAQMAWLDEHEFEFIPPYLHRLGLLTIDHTTDHSIDIEGKTFSECVARAMLVMSAQGK
jgi:hypothetical protein